MRATEPTGFLYPFLDAGEADAGEVDADRLLADLAASARAKLAESAALASATVAAAGDALSAAAGEMAARFAAGGRLLAFGNGGSATDAQSAVQLYGRPPAGRPLPALSLVEDQAVLTALANDVGYELVFARQVIAHAGLRDMAVGFSTSGGSANVLAAFAEARRRGCCTVGLSGYDGGAMAASGDLDHCLVVRSDSVHRIQEVPDALVWALWSATQAALESLAALEVPGPPPASDPAVVPRPEPAPAPMPPVPEPEPVPEPAARAAHQPLAGRPGR